MKGISPRWFFKHREEESTHPTYALTSLYSTPPPPQHTPPSHGAHPGHSGQEAKDGETARGQKGTEGDGAEVMEEGGDAGSESTTRCFQRTQREVVVCVSVYAGNVLLAAVGWGGVGWGKYPVFQG